MSFIKPYTETKDRSDKYSQKFDRFMTVEQAGKKICFYDIIQAAKDDAEIETVLIKYGCLDPIIVNKEEICKEYNEATELKSMLDQNKKIEDLFYNLPLEEREKFGHDIDRFVQEGIPRYEKELKELNDKILNEIKNKNTPKPEEKPEEKTGE